jgi:hypothetical protein
MVSDDPAMARLIFLIILIFSKSIISSGILSIVTLTSIDVNLCQPLTCGKNFLFFLIFDLFSKNRKNVSLCALNDRIYMFYEFRDD